MTTIPTESLTTDPAARAVAAGERIPMTEMSSTRCSDVLFLGDDVETYVGHFLEHGTPTTEAVDRAMCYLGRNLTPCLLWRLHQEGLLTDQAVQQLVGAAWSACEFPDLALDFDLEWAELFRRAGYVVDGRPAARPDHDLVLYRGSSSAHRWGHSWTDDEDLATWFAARTTLFSQRDPGHVWMATVEPRRLLARNTQERRGESEFVIDTYGLSVSCWVRFVDSMLDDLEAEGSL